MLDNSNHVQILMNLAGKVCNNYQTVQNCFSGRLNRSQSQIHEMTDFQTEKRLSDWKNRTGLELISDYIDCITIFLLGIELGNIVILYKTPRTITKFLDSCKIQQTDFRSISFFLLIGSPNHASEKDCLCHQNENVFKKCWCF